MPFYVSLYPFVPVTLYNMLKSPIQPPSSSEDESSEEEELDYSSPVHDPDSANHVPSTPMHQNPFLHNENANANANTNSNTMDPDSIDPEDVKHDSTGFDSFNSNDTTPESPDAQSEDNYNYNGNDNNNNSDRNDLEMQQANGNINDKGIWLDLELGEEDIKRVYLNGEHNLTTQSTFGELIDYLRSSSKFQNSAINTQDWRICEPDFGESMENSMEDSKSEDERNIYERDYGVDLFELESEGIEFGTKYENNSIIGDELKNKFYNRKLIVLMECFSINIIDGKNINISIDVCATQTIKWIKNKIRKERNLIINTLVYQGNEMNDDVTLAQYRITQGGYTLNGRIVINVSDNECGVNTEVEVPFVVVVVSDKYNDSKSFSVIKS